VDKHVAAAFHATPCKLAGNVFNVAARLAIRGEECFCPQAEPGVFLQPAVLLLASRMCGAFDPAGRQCIEARGIDINQSRRARYWRSFLGTHHLRVYSSTQDFETCPNNALTRPGGALGHNHLVMAGIHLNLSRRRS
jgi:hypothetical protein